MLILGLEIGLIVFGLVALVRGKITVSKTKVVEGIPARLLGALALTPLPIAFMVGVAIAATQPNPEQFVKDNQLTIALIEAGIVLGIGLLVVVIGLVVGTDPAAARRRSRDRYEDDIEEDYDDRPRRRSRREYDDEDDDDRDDRRRRDQ